MDKKQTYRSKRDQFFFFASLNAQFPRSKMTAKVAWSLKDREKTEQNEFDFLPHQKTG